MPPRSNALFLRLLAGLLAVLVITSLVYLIAERQSGHRALQSIREAMQAEGTLRPLSEIAPPPTAEALAQSQVLLSAIEPLKAMGKRNSLIKSSPSVMSSIAPGVAAPIVGAPAPTYESHSEGTPKSWEDFRSTLDLVSPILTKAGLLLRAPLAFPNDYGNLKQLISPGETQELGFWFRAMAILHLHDGNPSEAIENLESMARLSEICGQPGTIISYTLATGYWSFGVSGLLWEVLQSPALTDQDLIRLQAIVARQDFIQSALRTLEIDAATTHFVYAEIEKASQSQRAPMFMDLYPPSGILSTPPSIALRGLLWPSIWASGDQAISLADKSAAIKKSRVFAREKNWSSFAMITQEKSQAPVTNYDLWRYPLAEILFDARIYRTLLRSAVRAETVRQLILTAIALKRYQLTHSAYPDTLAALVPDYLPSQPSDYFDGRNLKYRLINNSRYLLYAAGEDGIDNAGDPSVKNKETPRMSNGIDFVWPQPPSP